MNYPQTSPSEEQGNFSTEYEKEKNKITHIVKMQQFLEAII